MTLARMKDIKIYRNRMKSDNINVNIIPTNILSDDTWQKLYKDNADVVDNIAYKLYSQYVMEDVQNPLELNDYNITVEELTENAKSFMLLYKTTIDKLFELESITFSPIENYDRYEEATVNRTGNETDNTTKTGEKINTNITTGSKVNDNTLTGEKDITNVKSGNLTDTTITNGSVSNSVKNNQITTVKNEPTSYNTNLVDTSSTSYSGDADTSTTDYNNLTENKTSTFNDVTDKSTETYKNYKNTNTETYNNITNTNTENYNNISENNTKTYNDVKDTTESHIHGNIGVTTATAMMKEYVDFYSTYNFWNKFWELYIHLNCRADFDNMIVPL